MHVKSVGGKLKCLLKTGACLKEVANKTGLTVLSESAIVYDWPLLSSENANERFYFPCTILKSSTLSPKKVYMIQCFEFNRLKSLEGGWCYFNNAY